MVVGQRLTEDEALVVRLVDEHEGADLDGGKEGEDGGSGDGDAGAGGECGELVAEVGQAAGDGLGDKARNARPRE